MIEPLGGHLVASQGQTTTLTVPQSMHCTTELPNVQRHISSLSSFLFFNFFSIYFFYLFLVFTATVGSI